MHTQTHTQKHMHAHMNTRTHMHTPTRRACSSASDSVYEMGKQDGETHEVFGRTCRSGIVASDWPHRPGAHAEEPAVPQVHMDYCFIRESAEEYHSVVPVGRDRQTKLSFAHVVPFKGGASPW